MDGSGPFVEEMVAVNPPAATARTSAPPGVAVISLGLTLAAARIAHRSARSVIGAATLRVSSFEGAVVDRSLSFVPRLTEAVLDRVDLTELIRARVDLDALAAEIDVGVLAREVIDAVDIPRLVRDSTEAMGSDTVRGVRMRTVDADEWVTRAVDRVLRRRRAAATPDAR